jgi:hypothetical protein
MDPLLSEHPPESEDAMCNIYDKTRIVRCPHGLAAISLNPEGLYYPDGLDRYPHAVSMTTVSSPYLADGNDVAACERQENNANTEKVESAYSEGARNNLNNSLTRAFKQRKQETENSFPTFRPGVIVEDANEEQAESTYRSLQRQQPLDLIRDSRPYRELNPEMLATECTCTLRHGQSQTCKAGEHTNQSTQNAKANTAV